MLPDIPGPTPKQCLIIIALCLIGHGALLLLARAIINDQ